MVVPAPVKELDEAHAAFDETSREEAVVCKGWVIGFVAGPRVGHGLKVIPIAWLCAVEVKDVLWFLADVHRIRDGDLHLVGEFVLLDAGDGFGVAEGFFLECVQLAHRIQGLAPQVTVHPGGV